MNKYRIEFSRGDWYVWLGDECLHCGWSKADCKRWIAARSVQA